MSTPGTGPLDTVDQIAFRWQGNQGRRGSGTAAAAWSCARERAEDLAHELAPMLRVDDALRPSIVRTVLQGGEAALVQRWPTADAGGRPNTAAHVLLGPANLLGPRTCLGLRDWTWSRQEFAEQESGRCDPVPRTALRDVAEPAWADTLAQLPDVREALTAATAALLRRPTHRLSLRSDALPGWPGENRSGVVIAGLYQVFGYRWLGRAWTFATYDMTDRHDLMVTWVADWSTDSGQQRSRYRIDPRRPEPDLAHELAGHLVERCLVATEEGRRSGGLPELTRELPDGAGLPAEARLRELADVLGVRPRRPGGGSTPAARPGEHPGPTGTGRPGSRRTTGPDGRAEGRAGDRADGWTDGWTGSRPDGRAGDRPHEGPRDRLGGAHTGGRHYEEGDDPDEAPLYEEPVHETPPPAPAPSPSPPSLSRLHEDLLGIGPAPSEAVRHELDRRIAVLSDRDVLGLLGEEALPFRAVNRLLDGLSRRGGRSAEQESELCAEVLHQRLYLYRTGLNPVGHDSADDDRLAERAAWLFRWAVAPHTRDPHHTEALGAWLGELVRPGTGLEARLLRRLVPPPGEQAEPGLPPDLPPELWRRLLHELAPGTPGTPGAAGRAGPAAVWSKAPSPHAGPAAPGPPAAGQLAEPPPAPATRAGAPGQPRQPVDRRPPQAQAPTAPARAPGAAVAPGPGVPVRPSFGTAAPPEHPPQPLYNQPHHQGDQRDDLPRIAAFAGGLLILLVLALTVLLSRH
ncbi:hypothetical protein OG535_06030 [Kitasatospora sp. NBC_00085]|uniref:hypothetical protein n=1 Tax=unclassified Kitasatospora TaxID=2633591 RepID=UPI0032455D4C